MSLVWLVGRRVTVAMNGHEYISDPFVAFENEAEADAVCDLVERISRERPMKTTAGFMSVSASTKKTELPPMTLTPQPDRRDERLADERLREILAHTADDLENWAADFDDAPHKDPVGEYDPRDIAALASELLALRQADEWQPIETAPKDRTAVLIAVPDKDRTGFIVGEAYFDPENDDGDWWWAGTGWGDYHAGPISEISYHHPTHWRPLPAPPALKDPANVR